MLPAEIVARAAAGDPASISSLDRWLSRLTRGLSTIVNVLDPDVIVVGGGLSNIDALYHGVARRLPDWVFSDVVRTEVRRYLHGDSSGVRGAAWLWRPDE
jgi:fructokinase